MNSRGLAQWWRYIDLAVCGHVPDSNAGVNTADFVDLEETNQSSML
jgi:hypothetical protein